MANPLQNVKDQFGGKEELVEKLAPLLDRGPDESEADFKDRLSRVSNKKLLRLLGREELLRDRFGSREALVDDIVASRTDGKGDADLRRKLLGLSTGRLLALRGVR